MKITEELRRNCVYVTVVLKFLNKKLKSKLIVVGYSENLNM